MKSLETKNRWQIQLATLVIFALGFFAGAFALNAYNLWGGAAKPPTKHERYQEAFGQLNLTESQNAEVQKIVAETRENMQEIRARNDTRLQSVLTDEQWTKFQGLRELIRQADQ